MKGWNKDQKQRARQQKPRLERIGAVRQKLIYHVGEEVDLGAMICEMGSTLHALTGIQNGKLSHTDSKTQAAVGWHWSTSIRPQLAHSAEVPVIVSVSIDNKLTADHTCELQQPAPDAPAAEPRKTPLELQRDSAATSERTLGPEHPATATSKSNLAAMYKAQGQHRKALELQLDVLTFSNRVLGSDHQETAKSKNNIACTYAELGDLVQAELFMRGAVSIWSKCHPPGHPELQSARQRWDQLKAALVNTCQKKQKAPSPNAPCPCGSGKKHKKCKCVEYHH